MNIIITGAAGFIGCHLAKFLSDQGKELILIDNLERSKKDENFIHLIKHPNIKFHNIDLTLIK